MAQVITRTNSVKRDLTGERASLLLRDTEFRTLCDDMVLHGKVAGDTNKLEQIASDLLTDCTWEEIASASLRAYTTLKDKGRHTPPEQQRTQYVTLLLRRPNSPETRETFDASKLTARDARWHVLTFGNKYNGATLQQIGSGEAELLTGESDGDGLRYLDWLLGQDWVASYTKAAIGAYLKHPTLDRRLDTALAAKDEFGAPVLQSVGSPDGYDLVPSCFTPSDEFDVSNNRWLGYRPGGRWVTKIKLARANDQDPTPAHWNTVGNLGERDNGDDTVDGDDDGWVDFQVFEDDELWSDAKPKARATIRNDKHAWEIASRYATRFEAIAPVDASEYADYLHLQVEAYNTLRREVLAEMADEHRNWFKIVDANCRRFLSHAVTNAKRRLAIRCKSLGLRLNIINGTLVIIEPVEATHPEEPSPYAGLASLIASLLKPHEAKAILAAS